MSTRATLDPAQLEVAPGGERTCQLTVRNNSDIVDAYQIEVLGEPGAWAVAEPDTLSLYPGAEEATTIRFQPPRSPRCRAGEWPFAVRALPAQRPQDAVTVEGVVYLQPFAATTAEIVPRTSKGQRRARHELAIDNRGNVPITARLSGADPDGLLRVAARPDTLTVPPGEALFAKVAVRNRRLLWHGPPVTHPFQMLVETEAEQPIALDAGTVQTPVFPKATTKALAALAALLLLLVAGWFLLLKPAVNSAAKQAVDKPLSQVANKADDAKAQADAAKKKAESAADAANAVGAQVSGTPSATPSRAPAAPNTASSPAGINLSVSVGPGATSASSYPVPTKNTLVLTDLVLENPQGDTGRVDVLAGGNAILTLALVNFRDIDYHLVSPVEIPAGKTLSIRVTCQVPGPALVGTTGGNQCRTLMFASGTRRVPASPSPTPAPAG